MPSTVAAGKKGIRTYLRATEGLRPTDGVTVRSAEPLAEEMTKTLVVLGSVTIAYNQAGLQGRAETPTVSCWAMVVKAGSSEDTLDAAREAVEGLFSRVEQAFRADPSAGGAVLAPGRIVVTSGGLQESPVNWDGAAAWRVDRTFSISWTSHIT